MHARKDTFPESTYLSLYILFYLFQYMLNVVLLVMRIHHRRMLLRNYVDEPGHIIVPYPQSLLPVHQHPQPSHFSLCTYPRSIYVLNVRYSVIEIT